MEPSEPLPAAIDPERVVAEIRKLADAAQDALREARAKHGKKATSDTEHAAKASGIIGRFLADVAASTRSEAEKSDIRAELHRLLQVEHGLAPITAQFVYQTALKRLVPDEETVMVRPVKRHPRKPD